MFELLKTIQHKAIYLGLKPQFSLWKAACSSLPTSKDGNMLHKWYLSFCPQSGLYPKDWLFQMVVCKPNPSVTTKHSSDEKRSMWVVGNEGQRGASGEEDKRKQMNLTVFISEAQNCDAVLHPGANADFKHQHVELHDGLFCVFTAIYNFRAARVPQLSLHIGDVVHILEDCEGKTVT